MHSRKKSRSGHNIYVISLLVLLALIIAGSVFLVTRRAGGSAPVTSPVTPEIPAQVQENTDIGAGQVRISELMAKNHASLIDENGDFPDWVELENISAQAVSLDGFTLSDGSGEQVISGVTLAPGDFAVICLKDFGIALDETLFLKNGYGTEIDSMLCTCDAADTSLTADGACIWPTPGFANTSDGYGEYMAQLAAPAPLVINEVMTANIDPAVQNSDWVEIKNISAEAVELSGWTLSDSSKDYAKWHFPEYTLAPGEALVVYCTDDELENVICTGFSLSSDGEPLYLTDGSRIVDSLRVHNLGCGRSVGRIDGENGWFYFDTPTPGEDNGAGERRVSAKPVSVTPDGTYDGVDKLSVELSSPGSIYYTTDGSVPTQSSTLYAAPIELSATTVVRAIAVEDGAIQSAPATYTYFVNEDLTLPVISLVPDDQSGFERMYNNKLKQEEIAGSVTYYDGDERFTNACGIKMSGSGSLDLPKRSMCLRFRDRYGDGDLEYDVFGNGITTYSSLVVRAGEDYCLATIRNELFQALNDDADGKALTQQSRYCNLFINGKYWGIYCLKEDYSGQYYASHFDVSKDSVSIYKASAPAGSGFFEDVVQFTRKNDMSVPENYEKLCSVLDIDSLIDWFIFEGYSANGDIGGNLRYIRSTEGDGKWRLALYDLDWGFFSDDLAFNIVTRPADMMMDVSFVILSLTDNDEFMDRLLTRFAEVRKSVLSNEYVLAKIDEYEALLSPDIARDKERWDLTENIWRLRMNDLRSFVTDNDWENGSLGWFCRALGINGETREKYFGS